MSYQKKGASKILKNQRAKKYKRRSYKDGAYVIYTSESGFICQCNDDETSKLVLDALNESYERAQSEV